MVMDIPLNHYFKVKLFQSCTLFILESFENITHFFFFPREGKEDKKQRNFLNMIPNLETEKSDYLVTFTVFCDFFFIISVYEVSY